MTAYRGRVIAIAPIRPPIKRYRILRFGKQMTKEPHCRIGRVTPTEQGLRCREFMLWLFNRPIKSPPDWTMTRFMRVE